MNALRLTTTSYTTVLRVKSVSIPISRFRTYTMASSNSIELPEGFLDVPAPNITKRAIDFKKEGIPRYNGQWAVVLDGVLSQDECDLFIKAAEATTGGEWERVGHNTRLPK